MKIINLHNDEVSAKIKLDEHDARIAIGGFNRKALIKLLLKSKTEIVCLDYVDVTHFDDRTRVDKSAVRMLVIDEEYAMQED